MSEKDLMKKCRECKYYNDEDALHCAECGSKIKTNMIFSKILKFIGWVLFVIFIIYVSYENKIFNLMKSNPVYMGSMEVQDIGSDKLSFNEANEYCKVSQYASKNDWRLPNLEELKLIYSNKSMLNYSNTLEYYWSSSVYKLGSENVSIVYFKDGNLYYGNKTNVNYVHCVRSRE